jgi:hypothetical protein
VPPAFDSSPSFYTENKVRDKSTSRWDGHVHLVVVTSSKIDHDVFIADAMCMNCSSGTEYQDAPIEEHDGAWVV